MSSISTAVAIDVGAHHACALLRDGSVVCWGANDKRQLGHDKASDALCGGSPCNRTPTAVPGVTGATGIVAGDAHACAWNATKAWCWGSNAARQLGGAAIGGELAPQDVTGIPSFVRISTAADFSGGNVCSIDSARVARCWGSDAHGRLGRAETCPDGCTPGAVEDASGILNDAVSIAATDGVGCAVRAGGSVVCWGFPGYGVSPDPEGFARKTMPGIANAVEVDAAQIHACARTSNNKIHCWGGTHHGQLGVGLTGDAATCTGGLPCRRAPVELPGADAIKLSVGREITMFQRPDGSLWAVGYNSDGRLGHSPATDTQCGAATDKCALSPVKVVGLP